MARRYVRDSKGRFARTGFTPKGAKRPSRKKTGGTITVKSRSKPSPWKKESHGVYRVTKNGRTARITQTRGGRWQATGDFSMGRAALGGTTTKQRAGIRASRWASGKPRKRNRRRR